MWDPPRTGVKSVLCIGRQIPTHCSTKEALNVFDSQLNWSPDAKSWFIAIDPDATKDWGQEEKGAAEDEMVGWQHQFSGSEFEQNLGNGEGQERLVCCSPWGCKVGYNRVTEQQQKLVPFFIPFLAMLRHWALLILATMWSLFSFHGCLLGPVSTNGIQIPHCICLSLGQHSSTVPEAIRSLLCIMLLPWGFKERISEVDQLFALGNWCHEGKWELDILICWKNPKVRMFM